jgi:hypothetical protein
VVLENSYFLGILAAFNKLPFSSINPHRLEIIFGLNANKFFLQVAI